MSPASNTLQASKKKVIYTEQENAKYMTGMDVQKLSNEFTSRAKSTLGSELVSLMLYGSAARGTTTSESDLDIFAVVEDDSDKEKLFDIAAEFLKEGVLFSIISETSDEFTRFKTMRSPFMDTVLKEGRVLYG